MTQRFQTERCSLPFGRRESHCFVWQGKEGSHGRFSYFHIYTCTIV